MSVLEMIVLWSMAAIFVISSSLNLIGPAFIKEEFANWNYPSWFRFLVGTFEMTAAILFLIPHTGVYGALFALPILIGVIFSLWKTKEWLRMMLPALLLALAVGVLIQHWDAIVATA